MKQTLNTHDIYALVTELSSWKDYRVLNVYDIDSKTICIKFNSDKSEKKYLLIESGTKFYVLDQFSATKDFPSSFCSKLRKHINNKRLESIVQVNLDRVIDIQFGSGELAYHIIGEFYASGNIIFTDNQYKILTLVHPYTYIDNSSNENKIKVNVGQKYPFEFATTNLELSVENIKKMFETNLPLVDKKIKLKQFITKLPLVKYSPNVLEHVLNKIGINVINKISSETKFEDIFISEEKINLFINEIKEMFEIKNFIGYKTIDNVYPFEYSHINFSNAIKYDNFMMASGKFFNELKPIETKEQVKKKETQVKLSKQEKAIWNIQQQINLMDANITQIHSQIDLLTQNIEQISIIFSEILKYGIVINSTNDTNNIPIQINEVIQHKKTVKIQIDNAHFVLDYSKSVWENREILFSQIKKIQDKKSNAIEILMKQQKTLEKSQYFKNKIANTDLSTSSNIDLPISSNSIRYQIHGQTKSNWFEQFNWFFTSDNILFISGKTADQNELIVKKYMDQDDIYIHSEVFGSGSGVLKNTLKINIPEICPKSLIEAGEFLISHTKTWSTGVPDKAYWVRPSQVSKTPETGEFLTKGSFVIRGQKNFIPVDRMELGFGFIFKIANSDKFAGTVGKDEQIEYAIPILSAYSACGKNKFKVKVNPGNQKIKKILPEVISNFIKKSNPYEKESIKKVSNDSIQKVLISNLRFII